MCWAIYQGKAMRFFVLAIYQGKYEGTLYWLPIRVLGGRCPSAGIALTGLSIVAWLWQEGSLVPGYPASVSSLMS